MSDAAARALEPISVTRGDVTSNADTVGDTLHGGDGNDRFHTRDGEVDTVDCGPGNDVALLDFKDVMTDPTACETVKRAAPRPADAQSQNKTQTEPEDSKQQ